MGLSSKKAVLAAVGVALAMSSTTTLAASAGDWILRFGVTNVSPNDDSGDLTGVPGGKVAADGDTQPSINITYMLSDNLGLEVLGSLPFTHEISGAGVLSGAGKVAETKQLPPTVSLQYHFSPQATVRPYVGAGINYTLFYDETTTGALAGTDISLDNSVGLAVQAGVDVDINKDWFWNADVRYITIDTTAETVLGSVDVDINPWVFTLGVGTTF